MIRIVPLEEASDELPFTLKHSNPALIDCVCVEVPFLRRGRHSRECLRWRAEREREHELAHALKPEDIRWLNAYGWDGRFE